MAGSSWCLLVLTIAQFGDCGCPLRPASLSVHSYMTDAWADISCNQQTVFVHKENIMSLGTILIILLILALIGALPAWPYSSGWGYGPTGGLGLVLLIVVILLLTGRL